MQLSAILETVYLEENEEEFTKSLSMSFARFHPIVFFARLYKRDRWLLYCTHHLAIP